MHDLKQAAIESRLELSERKRIQLQKRLTRKAVDEEIPLWSMVDLMSLLLICFLFFYSTAIDRPHSAPVSALQNSLDNSAISQAAVYTDIQTNQMSTIDSPEQTIEQFREEVLETMDEGDKELFSVSSDQHRLVFILGERITFQEGEAILLDSYRPLFVQIAGFIASKPEYQIVVSGHTDNKPISTSTFPSNLELSSARAVTVAKFLIKNGVKPQRVSIQGFSEYRPLFENTTPENRQKNRRVEIALIKEQGSDSR